MKSPELYLILPNLYKKVLHDDNLVLLDEGPLASTDNVACCLRSFSSIRNYPIITAFV